MKKRTLLIVAGFAAILLFTVLSILISGRSYSLYLQNPYDSELTSVVCSNEDVVRCTSVERDGDYTRFTFQAVKKGTCSVEVTIYDDESPGNRMIARSDFTVLQTGVLYVTGFDYGGFPFTVLGMALLTLYAFALSLTAFLKRKKSGFFSYRTMLDFALIVFFGLQGLMYLGLYGSTLILPEVFDGWRLFNISGFIMMVIFMLSLPAAILFSVFMTLSNLSLIRHEGFGKNNLFGILISLTLFAGSVLCVVSAFVNPNSTNVELSEVRDAVLRVVFSTAFVYFECILLSAMYCTLSAARHEPDYDRDFIIILGCRVGSDGKPLPLLRGRIDRALAFYRRQLETTGKQAYFIPSGGKGSDEVISEAACMKNYLMEQGIDEERILPEDRSTTTLENMRFSKKIADAHKENANILFSTTNYHVFRSGLFAEKAGMHADGVGAKTKWYFWPNAQIREFVGLLASEWKINLLLVLLIVFMSVLFSSLGTLISWLL